MVRRSALRGAWIEIPSRIMSLQLEITSLRLARSVD